MTEVEKQELLAKVVAHTIKQLKEMGLL